MNSIDGGAVSSPISNTTRTTIGLRLVLTGIVADFRFTLFRYLFLLSFFLVALVATPWPHPGVTHIHILLSTFWPIFVIHWYKQKLRFTTSYLLPEYTAIETTKLIVYLAFYFAYTTIAAGLWNFTLFYSAGVVALFTTLILALSTSKVASAQYTLAFPTAGVVAINVFNSDFLGEKISPFLYTFFIDILQVNTGMLTPASALALFMLALCIPMVVRSYDKLGMKNEWGAGSGLLFVYPPPQATPSQSDVTPPLVPMQQTRGSNALIDDPIRLSQVITSARELPKYFYVATFGMRRKTRLSYFFIAIIYSGVIYATLMVPDVSTLKFMLFMLVGLASVFLLMFGLSLIDTWLNAMPYFWLYSTADNRKVFLKMFADGCIRYSVKTAVPMIAVLGILSWWRFGIDALFTALAFSLTGIGLTLLCCLLPENFLSYRKSRSRLVRVFLMVFLYLFASFFVAFIPPLAIFIPFLIALLTWAMAKVWNRQDLELLPLTLN